MSKLRYSLLLLASLSLGAQAYPGMQPKDHNQIQSSVDKINVLPHSFPLEVVPFQDKTGSQLDFSQHKGKVVLVNIWLLGVLLVSGSCLLWNGLKGSSVIKSLSCCRFPSIRRPGASCQFSTIPGDGKFPQLLRPTNAVGADIPTRYYPGDLYS